MVDINTRQKDPENLEFWKAYTVKYSEAKQYRIPRIIFSYLLLFAAPFIILNNPHLKTSAAIFGAGWAIISVFISYYEKDIIKVAAKLQDEFDTRVFNIKWNKIFLGDHISQEVVHSLSNKFKGEIDERWYGDLNTIPYPFNIILCQRSNIVWDWRLRKNYYLLSLSLLLLVFIGGILLAVHYELKLENYLTTVFFPSSSAYVLGFKELKEHLDNYTSKETLEKRLNNIIDAALTNNTQVDEYLLRQVQDVIYSLRKCPAVVPKAFYKFYKKKYEERMQFIINKFSSRLIREQ